jgi:hypothetical protein
MLSSLTRGFAWYSKQLDLHPILTKSISGGVLGAFSDFLCQKVETGKI